jgi:hypothetical protein
MAHEDDGSIWVADAANLRTLHLDSNSGRFLGSVDYVVASYSSTVSSEQPSRVFSNYREYEVKYSGGRTPLNQSWSLVRNWAAGLDSNWTKDNSHFEGFHAVEQTKDNKTMALVNMINGHTSLVELPSDDESGLRLILQLPGGSFSLEKGAALRYSVSHFSRGTQEPGVQEVWEAPYDVATGKEAPLFLRHLHICTCTILPRQARDKHRENSKKEWRFLRELVATGHAREFF